MPKPTPTPEKYVSNPNVEKKYTGGWKYDGKDVKTTPIPEELEMDRLHPRASTKTPTPSPTSTPTPDPLENSLKSVLQGGALAVGSMMDPEPSSKIALGGAALSLLVPFLIKSLSQGREDDMPDIDEDGNPIDTRSNKQKMEDTMSSRMKAPEPTPTQTPKPRRTSNPGGKKDWHSGDPDYGKP